MDMDKNTYTHTFSAWEKIAQRLRVSWPKGGWPSGSVQRSATCVAAEIQDHLNGSVIEQRGFTIRVDDDDYDTKLALQMAGA